MNKQNNEIKKDEVVFEFIFRITNKDYKISLSTRRAWIVGVVIIVLRLILSFTGHQNP